MDSLAPLANKWTLAVLSAATYHFANRYELLGEASDPRIEPIQSIVVGLLVLLACFVAEWSWRRRGFLPHLVLTPDAGAGSAKPETMIFPSSWDE